MKQEGLYPHQSSRLDQSMDARSLPGRANLRTIFGVAILAFLAGALAVTSVLDYSANMPPTVPELVYPAAASRSEYETLRHNSSHKYLASNLRPDLKYMTTTRNIDGGHTNQVMSIMKLIYISGLLDRVAILPDLVGEHGEMGYEEMSRFYDVPQLAQDIGVSIIAWRDVKTRQRRGVRNARERIDCWHAHQSTSDVMRPYGVDVHYRSPPYESLVHHVRPVTGMDFDALTIPSVVLLASNVFPPTGRQTSVSLAQLLCVGHLMYTPPLVFDNGDLEEVHLERFEPDDPVWKAVGSKLHFSSAVQEHGKKMIQSILGDKEPLYIGVHIRQGDFIRVAMAHRIDEYFSPVDEIQELLRSGRRSSGDLPVLFASDTKDPKILQMLADRGWHYLDHSKFDTVRRLGTWWPGVLDSYILSHSRGFVGTSMSTFSALAASRVEAWGHGYSAMV